MEKRDLTCIGCPLGCQITVTMENGEVTDVKGNTCPRGDKYAREEEKDLVKIDYENMKDKSYEVLEDDLLVTDDGTIKHDSLKLSSMIFSYLMRK